jgi:uncharacterized cupin superfamily protein
MVGEAKLEQRPEGLTPVSEGWYTTALRDAPWWTSEVMGAACVFEGEGGVAFPQIGIQLAVLAPGQPNGMYHRESNQEDFLVLSGECLLLIEEQERRLQAGDFVHCPPETDHIFVGAGSGPCAILMVGARVSEAIAYPRSELALRHEAGVETETTSPKEAYARFPEWAKGRPEGLAGLPWAP